LTGAEGTASIDFGAKAHLPNDKLRLKELLPDAPVILLRRR
jgi:hypothetical protein